jgi:hypothetical protein
MRRDGCREREVVRREGGKQRRTRMHTDLQ